MRMDPDAVLAKPARVVTEWLYFEAEEANYRAWVEAEAEWRASRALEGQVH